MIDTSLLRPAERALFEAIFPNGIKSNVRACGTRGSSLDALWLFAAACYRHPSVGTLPTVAVETLDARGYRPRFEFELWAVEAAPIRRARWRRQERIWKTLVLVHVRRAQLRAQRDSIVALLIAEGERARLARRRRWLMFPRGIMRATVSGRQTAALLAKLIVALVLAVLIYFAGLIVVMLAGGTECGDCPWWGDLFKWPAALAVITVSFVIVFALLSGAMQRVRSNRVSTTPRHK